jgi:hypothetical protein
LAARSWQSLQIEQASLITAPIHYVIWLTLRLLGHKVALLAYAPLAAMTQDGSARVFLGALGCFLVFGLSGPWI